MEPKLRLGKALLIGGLLTLLIAVVDPIRVLVSKGAALTSDYSTGAALFYFFLVIIANGTAARINRGAALSEAELVLIYGMMIVGCAIPTWGFTLNLIPLLPGIHYYATTSPDFENLVLPHVKSWLTVNDPNAVAWFFEGLPKHTPFPWQAWLLPLSCWSLLIVSVYLLSICLMFLFSKRWIEEERLTYPLTYVPERLAEKKPHFPEIFRNRLFWLGVSIPAVLLSFSVLHVYSSALPFLQLQHNLPCFRGTVSLYLRVYFEVIGLIFFVPLDVSFGIWLFFLLMTCESGFFNIIGLTSASPEPWVFGGLANGYESMGAMLMMVCLMLWQERTYWRNILRNRQNHLVIWSSLLLFGIISGWLTLAGLKLPYSIFFTLLSLLTFIGITRVVCQAGTPYARSGAVPAGVTLSAFGTERIGSQGIAALNFTSAWACDLRTMVMTSVATFFKIGHTFKLHAGKIAVAAILAILLSLAGSIGSVLYISYKYGGINLGGWHFTGYVPYTMKWLNEYVMHPYGFAPYQFSFLGIGGLVYLGFFLLRMRFSAFPIHPIGLAIASTVPIMFTWFSIFLGWGLKTLILRYGGPGTYRKVQPFFLGLILGSFLTGGLWMFIDFITHVVPATHPILGA